jgi:hypothetical protein
MAALCHLIILGQLKGITSVNVCSTTLIICQSHPMSR